jgi:hypothetical protein
MIIAVSAIKLFHSWQKPRSRKPRPDPSVEKWRGGVVVAAGLVGWIAATALTGTQTATPGRLAIRRARQCDSMD